MATPPPTEVLSGFGSGREQQHKYYQYGSQMNINAPIIAHPYQSNVDLFRDTKPINIPYDEEEQDEDDEQKMLLPSSRDEEHADDNGHYTFQFSCKRLVEFAGPGWLMSIAYIDSGNLESDIQAGAIAGYSLIWILFWSTMIGWCLQSLSARLAVVTGQSLAELCRFEYNRNTSLFIWLCIELSIIGNDIQQVIGTAIAFHILFGFKLWAGCILTAIAAFTLLAINSWRGLRCMEYFFLSIIGVMSILFVVECIISEPDILSILQGWFLPFIDDASNTQVQQQAIGIVGAVIMPFNLFLHSSLVQLRNVSRSNANAIREANTYFSMEAGFSLLASFVINLCVMSVYASGFYENDAFDASSAGLLTAAQYLGQRFGTAAKFVWACGLFASGQSATMTGTFAGQYVMNGFLNLAWAPWKRTLLTRSIALVPALIVAVVATEQIDAANQWINVLESVILPFALLPLLFFSCNERVMGTLFVLSRKMQIFYAIIAFVVITVNVYLVCLFVIAWDVTDDSDDGDNNSNTTWFALKWVLLSSFLWLYLGFIAWLCWDFFLKQKTMSTQVQDENGDDDISKITEEDDEFQYSTMDANSAFADDLDEDDDVQEEALLHTAI